MSPKKIVKALDVYVRVSQVRGREGDSFISPELQEEKCRALAKARGVDVGKVFVDLDQSGGKMNRPAFNEMMSRIEDCKSGGVIVARIDRFARTLLGGLQAIERVEQAGGVVLTADGEFDTSTATGELVLRIMLSLAAFELRRIREGWRDARDKAKRRGVHLALAPAGFHRNGGGELLETLEHIEAVKKVYSTRAHGGSWNEAARALEEAAVPTNRGNTTWSRQAVYNLVRNPIYKERGVVPAWQWQKAQPRHDGKRGPRGEGYVLGGGLVRCGLCGQGMIRSSASGKGLLRCPGKGRGHACVNYDIATDYLLSVVFSHIGPQVRVREDGDGLYEAVEAAREEVSALEEQIGTTLPEDSKQRQALDEAERALAEFEAARDLPLGLGDVLTPVGVRREFEKLSVSEQRHVLRQVVSRAVVKPGRGLHVAERIEVEFTDGSRYPEPWSAAQVPGA